MEVMPTETIEEDVLDHRAGIFIAATKQHGKTRAIREISELQTSAKLISLPNNETRLPEKPTREEYGWDTSRCN